MKTHIALGTVALSAGIALGALALTAYAQTAPAPAYTYGGSSSSNVTTATPEPTTNTVTVASPTTAANGMPIFYNASGQQINPNGTAVAPGWYYNASGQSVYAYGDGTYYDPSNGTFYGLNGETTVISNPTAGLAAEETGTGSAVTPSVPNTGAGGDATVNFFVLVGSALVAAGGVTYLALARRAATLA